MTLQGTSVGSSVLHKYISVYMSMSHLKHDVLSIKAVTPNIEITRILLGSSVPVVNVYIYVCNIYIYNRSCSYSGYIPNLSGFIMVYSPKVIEFATSTAPTMAPSTWPSTWRRISAVPQLRIQQLQRWQ